MQFSDSLAPEARVEEVASASCFACGFENARGLRLIFSKTLAGEMRANWIPESDFEGFENVIHGGIITTVLDESMAKAVVEAGIHGHTAELKVRFRSRLAPGVPVEVKGWITSRKKRMIQAESVLTGSDGTEFAHAWGVFLTVK